MWGAQTFAESGFKIWRGCDIAFFLMQNRSNAFGLPIMKDIFLHVIAAVPFAFDKGRFIADFGLLFVNFGYIFVHGFRRDLHVTDRMKAVRFGILLPQMNAVGHQLSHGRLKIVVAYGRHRRYRMRLRRWMSCR